MADRLGIISRYRGHEVAHAAIHLAEWAEGNGVPASIYGVGSVRREVARSWDDRVITPNQQPIIPWAERQNRVVWTHVPQPHELTIMRELGPETCLLVNWEELVPEDVPTLERFDKLILPFRCVATALSRKARLNKVQPIIMPWDVPVPITRVVTNRPHRKLCAYFPLYDTQPQRIDQAVFTTMRRILAEVEDAHVLVSVGHSWARTSKQILKDLRGDYGDRVVVVCRPNILQRLMLFARADLTIWASRYESLATVGLSSIYMGTPVLSWDIRPHNEFLHNWKNAVLVPGEADVNWLGVPVIQSGFAAFTEAAVTTLKDKGLLARLKSESDCGLPTRRKLFRAGWDILTT